MNDPNTSPPDPVDTDTPVDEASSARDDETRARTDAAAPDDETAARTDAAARDEEAATHEAAAARGPSVDLRTGDPSPSGTDPDEGDVDDLTAGAPADDQDADEHEAGVDLESLADADPRSKAELIGAILDLEADRDAYLDDLRRARAEFENYRRRVTREAAAARKAGAADAVNALLEVLDDLDRTLEAAEASPDESLAKGVELVASKLAQGLRSIGVERIDAVGEPFDPTKHEAVQQLPADEGTEEPSVAQVLRPGYRLEDRVLRAAMVVVQG